jgi:hypothetical protein
MKAIVVAALTVLALIGAAWKWNAGGHPAKVAGWTWQSAAVDDGGSSDPATGWTW